MYFRNSYDIITTSNNVTVAKMKDISDSKTLDLIPLPKKRGRPSTGRAKSAAERMRDVRRRDVRKIGVDGQGFASMTLTGLYDHLRWSVKHGHVSDIQRICDELKGRALAQVEASQVEAPQVDMMSFDLRPELEFSQVEASQVEASQVEASQVEASQVVHLSDCFPGTMLLLDQKSHVSFIRYVGDKSALVSSPALGPKRVLRSRLRRLTDSEIDDFLDKLKQ